MWPLWASIRGFTVVMDHVPSSWLSGVAMASAHDSAWTVVTNAGKDDQGDEWFAFGSACGVVGIAEKGDCTYAGLMFRCGGDNSRIFCCMKDGDVGESPAFSVPLWGLGSSQGAMGGRSLVPGLALGGTNWGIEDGGNGVAVMRNSGWCVFVVIQSDCRRVRDSTH